MSFTKIAAAGIGSTELVTLHSLEVLNNATVGGVLTYEDVTNVDSIGIVTARSGVLVGSGITLSPDGDIFATGITTIQTDSPSNGVFSLGGTLQFHTDSSVLGIVSRRSGSGANFLISDDDTVNIIRTVDGRLHLMADTKDDVDDSEIRFLVDNNVVAKISAGSSLSFAADNNTFLSHPENDNLALTTTAEERLRVEPAGNINIAKNLNVAGVVTATTFSGNVTGSTGTFTGGIDVTSDVTISDSIVHSGDANTKIRFPGADQISFETAGVERMIIGSAGAISITDTIQHTGDTNTKIRFPSNDVISFETGGAERARIHTDGKIFIGKTTNRQTRLGASNFSPDIQIESETVATVSLTRFSDNDAPSRLVLQKGRGTIASPSVVQDGDASGMIVFSAWDGDTFTNTARITSEVEGTPGDDDMPGNLIFSTVPDGGVSPSEHFRITSTGRLEQRNNDENIDMDSSASGQLKLDGNGYTAAFALNATGLQIYTNSAARAIVFGINETEKIRIDTAGRLLIGTTTNSGTSTSGDDIIIGSIGDSTARGLTFATTGAGSIRWADSGDNAMGRIQYSNSTDEMTFHTNNAERMSIASDGDITISPSGDPIVTITGSGHAKLRLITTSNSDHCGVNFGDSDDDNAGMIQYTHSTNLMQFHTNGSDRVNINSGGQLLIGNGSAASPSLSFKSNTDSGFWSNSDNNFYAALDGETKFRFNISHFSPGIDNSYDLGNNSYRWDDVRATNGTIATSDRNEKNTITATDLGLDFVNKLSPVSYKFNGRTRTHYGLIAQDIETVLTDIGKSTTNFAGFIKDTVDDDGNSLDPARYGLRYQEFISPMIKAIQELSAENTALKARVAALEG